MISVLASHFVCVKGIMQSVLRLHVPSDDTDLSIPTLYMTSL